MAGAEEGFVLYVKASARDSKSLGADIAGHRLMMILALKNLAVAAKIVPVDTIKKTNVQLDFPYKNLPTLVVELEDDKLKDIDEPLRIEDAFEKTFEPSLKVENKDINSFVTVQAGSTVYHKFSQFIKNHDPAGDPMLRANLATELRKVNSFLLSDKVPKNENGERMFLAGENPGIPDCYLLPKLHHIYIACTYVKEFTFESLPGIEAYLELGRKHPAFANTSAAKADIVDFYCRQANLQSRKQAEIMRKVESEEA